MRDGKKAFVPMKHIFVDDIRPFNCILITSLIPYSIEKQFHLQFVTEVVQYLLVQVHEFAIGKLQNRELILLVQLGFGMYKVFSVKLAYLSVFQLSCKIIGVL